MRVLTVRQPWASLLVTGRKDIENRTWATHYRGPVYILAGKCTPDRQECDRLGIEASELPCGGIIGRVILRGCVTASSSPWFSGPIGWQFDEASACELYPFRGALGLGIAADLPAGALRFFRYTPLLCRTRSEDLFSPMASVVRGAIRSSSGNKSDTST